MKRRVTDRTYGQIIRALHIALTLMTFGCSTPTGFRHIGDDPYIRTIASEAPSGVNLVCKQNQITSLKAEKLPKFQNGPDDYCQVPEGQMPTVLQDLARKAGVVHQKAADYFRVSVDDLLPGGIELTVRGSGLGDLDESASGNSVKIYEFPDWDGHPSLDESIYAHELGHVIRSIDSKTPSILHEVRGITMVEFFPDFLALALYGTAYQPTSQAPACLVRAATRNVSKVQSFSAPALFFDERYVYQQLNQCFKDDPALQNDGPGKTIYSAIKPIISKPEFSHSPNGQFDPQQCFPPPPNENPFGCDPHQIAIPANSFLHALNKHLSGKGFSIYRRALVNASNGPRTQFSCYFDNPEGRQHPVSVSLHSERSFYSNIRSLLGPGDQQVFDDLWKRADLETGMRLGDMGQGRHAMARAYQEMEKLVKGGNDSYYSLKNECFTKGNPYGMVYPPGPPCVLKCDVK